MSDTSLKRPNQHSALSEWLTWLENLHVTEIDLGLDRIQQVATKLKLAADNGFVITVAGTNGKGSTCAYLEAGLLSNGFSVGKYSSPHFLRFNERICVNGLPVTDLQIVEALNFVEQGRGDISLTYFEYTTLAAIQIFQSLNLDYWVLEVGLGGRLDAVNLIDPDISVVTSIGLDHEDWLGSDLTQIGREKAGIVRSGKPVVVSVRDNATGVLEVAKQKNARVYLVEEHFDSTFQGKDRWQWQGVKENDPCVIPNLVLPKLPFANIAAAYQVLALISVAGENLLANPATHKALSEAQLTGRNQVVTNQGQEYVLDVAHNPQAANNLVEFYLASNKKVEYIVIGMLNDKDSAGVIKELVKLNPEQILLVDLQGPRGQTAEQLQALCPSEIPNQTFSSVVAALDYLESLNQQLERSSQQTRTMVCGSFYTVADALQKLTKD